MVSTEIVSAEYPRPEARSYNDCYRASRAAPCGDPGSQRHRRASSADDDGTMIIISSSYPLPVSKGKVAHNPSGGAGASGIQTPPQVDMDQVPFHKRENGDCLRTRLETRVGRDPS